MLGVTESTLRQWTDEGKIRAFVTPGGHRRYAESEVEEFMGAQRRVHGVRDLVARIELTPPIELEVARTRFATAAWYGRLTPAQRGHLGALGRKVHGLVLRCVVRPNKREQNRELARDVGREFGTYLAEIGLSLVDSVEAFLLHRAPLIEAATELMRRREALDERAAEAVLRVARTTDEVLLALVEAYQGREAALSGRESGRT